MITLQDLKDMEPHSIFASGTTIDDADGINMDSSGKTLHWVAVRGGVHDWAIYCHYDSDPEFIKRHGDKIHFDSHIRKLVECDDAAFDMYRH